MSTLRLIYLHGPPAVGKRTIAHALGQQCGIPVLGNHATIDLARTIFEFGVPGFWPLVHRLRNEMIETAASSGLSALITTGCYIHPDDVPLLADGRISWTGGGASCCPCT